MSVVDGLEAAEVFQDVADQLDELQQKENDGRGVSCVRTLVFYLKRGDYRASRALINNEWDKIRNYEPITWKIFELDVPFAKVGEKPLVGDPGLMRIPEPDLSEEEDGWNPPLDPHSDDPFSYP